MRVSSLRFRDRRRYIALKSLIRRALGLPPAASPWANDELLREELSASSGSSSTRRASPRRSRSRSKPLARRSLGARLSDNDARSARGLSRDCRRGGRGPRHHAGGGMAARQLPPGRGADPRDPRRPAAGLLPPTAEARGRAVRGYPRVFGLAWAFVAHTDSRFDPETLRRFVRAYQRVQPLTIGELWAVAITLRIVLVENLRRAARAHRQQSRRARGSRRGRGPAAGLNG